MAWAWLKKRRAKKAAKRTQRQQLSAKLPPEQGDAKAKMAALEAELGDVKTAAASAPPAPGGQPQAVLPERPDAAAGTNAGSLLNLNPLLLYQTAVENRVAQGQELQEREQKSRLAEVRVTAFVGPSGTGKSTQAIRVARENRIDYFIDDGLLIHGGHIVAGSTAKRAETKIESVRQALFVDETKAGVMRRALAENRPEQLLILGTSDAMIERICDNLWLPRPCRRIGIEEVTNEEERRLAKMTRMTEGQHTIPVPSMEIKHEFSGYFSAFMDRFWRRSGSSLRSAADPERTVVRPTFSTLGHYSLSDEAMRHLVELIGQSVLGVAEVLAVELHQTAHGVLMNCKIAVFYGYSAPATMQAFQQALSQELERYTSINLLSIGVQAARVAHAQADSSLHLRGGQASLLTSEHSPLTQDLARAALRPLARMESAAR